MVVYRLMTRRKLAAMYRMPLDRVRAVLRKMDVYHGTKSVHGHAVEYWFAPSDFVLFERLAREIERRLK